MGWQKESWRTLKRDTSDNVFFSVRGSTFSSEQEGKGRNRKKKRTQPEKWTVRAIHPREKAENERRRGGKGERGPHKYSRVDGRRQGGRGGRQRKKEIEHDVKRELRTSERKKVERNCTTMVRTRVDFIRGRPS